MALARTWSGSGTAPVMGADSVCSSRRLRERSVAPGRGRGFDRLGEVELDLEQPALWILPTFRTRQLVQEALAGLDLHRPHVGGGHVQALALEQVDRLLVDRKFLPLRGAFVHGVAAVHGD